MKYSKISIMIPTFNQYNYVSQTIESALKQDYPNFEVIISDDCSKDTTFDIIKKYQTDPRIRYYRNEINIGRVRNYYKLLYQYAEGDWVINLDGDDYFYNNSYLNNAMKIAQKDPDIAFVFGDQIVLEEDTNKIYIETNKSLPEIIEGNLLFMNFPTMFIRIPHLSLLYNRQKAITTGFYTKDIISSDWESVLRLMINNKVGYIKKIAGVWRKHQSNESKIIDFQKVIANFKLVDSVIKYVERENTFNDSQISKWREDMYYRLAKSILSKYLLLSSSRDVLRLLKHFKQNLPKTFRRIVFNLKNCIEILFSIYPPFLKAIYRHRYITKKY